MARGNGGWGGGWGEARKKEMNLGTPVRFFFIFILFYLGGMYASIVYGWTYYIYLSILYLFTRANIDYSRSHVSDRISSRGFVSSHRPRGCDDDIKCELLGRKKEISDRRRRRMSLNGRRSRVGARG